ncbi:class I SAM-dependent methyltransferase [Roseibacterium sp. SDUM158016]|uniref:class I SAM-dependent DNA methyltransferase n=1 Tax=Roseicyclus sediminis TaxID=2980997 RepID=UPI0021D30865|nr:class I SAM-dependent methyltransferase [Roseibacterium sp. SDUM158016]MCU4651253.1 class I SAM-dependent methyltransferase [Roseibacterium sp. SDUM158016]
MSDEELERAYALNSPDEARALYESWAGTYDTDFVDRMGYASPRRAAEIYLAEGADEPCLDVGAGTGAVAEHLRGIMVDALDLSAEMLGVAAGKGLYRQTIEADLNAPLDLPDAAYGGMVSAGTFTHGHVGPGCLPELLRIVRPGSLFVFTVLPGVYDGMGFGTALARLQAGGRISPLRFADIAIFENAGHAHAGDRSLVVIFRKT